jgi:hypothetical protein
VSIDFDDLPNPIKYVSNNEPDKVLILEKIMGIINHYDISKEVTFKSLHQNESQKVYYYKIGEIDCFVLVERVEMIENP